MAKRSARTVWLNNVCTLTVSVVTLIHSFVARDRIRVSHAPAEEAFKTKNKVEPLGTGVDTHLWISTRRPRLKNLRKRGK